MLNSQDQDIITSGNSLRQNQRRMNRIFDDEDHKNMKTFHLKNQMDNDILVKDEQDDISDFMHIVSDQSRNHRLGLYSNSAFNPSYKIQSIQQIAGEEQTANWKIPSEAKRDPQKSITLLNLQSMDETSKHMLQQEIQFQKKLKQIHSPLALDQTANPFNIQSGLNQNNSHNHTEQSIKQIQKSTFPYNVYQTANKLRQKLMSKLERSKISNITTTHLRMIDDWSSQVNNRVCTCSNSNCSKEEHLDNVKKKICCFSKQLQCSQKTSNKGISNQQQQQQQQQQLQCVQDATKQLESISIGSNSNFTQKKKILHLLQSIKSFKDQPTNSDSKEEKKENRKSIIQIYSSILLMLSCITRALNPTSIFRIVIDSLQLIFLAVFYFFITLRAVFTTEIDRIILNGNENIERNTLIYYLSCVGFAIQLSDMLLSYFTGFYHKGVLILDPNISSIRYFRKYFIFDFISVMILLLFILNDDIPNVVTQILYFLKIFSSTENLKRIKLKVSISKIRKVIYRSFINSVFFLLILHTFTIVWIALTQNESYSQSRNLPQNMYWIRQNFLLNQSWDLIYTAALSYMTRSFLFQGGQPMTQGEQLFTTLTQICSIIIVYYFVVQILKIAKLMNPTLNVSDEKVLIKLFLPMRQLSESYIIRVKQLLKYKRGKKLRKYDEQQITNQMNLLTPSLRDEVLYEINKKIINKMEIMKNFTNGTNVLLSKHIDELLFETGQIIYFQGEETDNDLYFIGKGTVELFYITEKRCKDEDNYLIFKKLSTGQHFGELSFFTGMPRESYARCSKEAIIFRISRNKFRQIIQDNKKDLELFCEIKDDLLLENKHSQISQMCPICKKERHQVIECQELHFVANKEKAILSSNVPEVQVRSLNTAKRKVIKFNAWAFQRRVFDCAQKVEDNSTLYNKCVLEAMNTSQAFYDQRLNESDCDLDEINEHYKNHEGGLPNNDYHQQNAKQFQSMDALPSRNNLVYTDFDLDKEPTSIRRKSEFLQNLNTLNTTNKQRSFTKEEELMLDQRSGNSFLYPLRKDTSHAVSGGPNTVNPNSQGNILIPTQPEINASPIPSPIQGEQSFFSNHIKSKQQLSKNNSNNFPDEQSNNSLLLLNGISPRHHHMIADLNQRTFSPEELQLGDKMSQNKDVSHPNSPNVLRKKKKNLTWNIDQVQEMPPTNNGQLQTTKVYAQNHMMNVTQSTQHQTQNISNNIVQQIINHSNIISNTNTTPLSYSSSNMANTTNNQINNQTQTNNNIYDQVNYQTSPNLTHQTRRVSQTPKTLYLLQKEEQVLHDELLNSRYNQQRSKSNIGQSIDNLNNLVKNSDSNFSEQVQYYQSPNLEIQNGYTANRMTSQTVYQNTNVNMGYSYNNATTMNNLIINSANNIHGNGGGSSNLVNNNDAFTEHSKLQKQTSTRKRTSSKFNDSQYKADTDSQNSTSQFKKVTSNKKKKNLTIIQEQQSPPHRNLQLMKKSSMINQMLPQNILPIQSLYFDDSNVSQLLPMATSLQFTNNYLDTKKPSIAKVKSQFNQSQILSSIDFQQQYHPLLVNQQLFGDLLPEQVEQSMLYSLFNDKSKHSFKQSKLNLPKLSYVLPQFQTLNPNIQAGQTTPLQQFQQQNSFSRFFQNMNGRLRKSLALKKIQNNQEYFQTSGGEGQQLGYNFYPGFDIQRNNLISMNDLNKYYNMQYVSYYPKQDEPLESIKEYQFYKPHNNIQVILKQIKNQLKNSKKKKISLHHAGNSFFVYSLKMNKKWDN